MPTPSRRGFLKAAAACVCGLLGLGAAKAAVHGKATYKGDSVPWSRVQMTSFSTSLDGRCVDFTVDQLGTEPKIPDPFKKNMVLVNMRVMATEAKLTPTGEVLYTRRGHYEYIPERTDG
jgi:hypothetical protein